MAGTNPIRNEYLRIGSPPDTALNDEYYGRRMQMLLNAGAGRFLEMAPDSLIQLASGPDSDEDMMNTFYGAFDQNNFNVVKQRFQSMPSQMQGGEFNRLPKKMQELLRSAGYELPEEKDPDGLLKRIFTWDIPLLPEEHFGTAVKVGMAPIRAVGFGVGTVARNVWEFGIMKPSRYATRLGRSLAFLDERDSGAFLNPARWREAWNNARLEDGSYYKETTDAAIEKVGADQTDLLKIFIRDGAQGVYDHFEDAGKAFGYSDVEIRDRYQKWYGGLSEQDNTEALEILESGQLTLAAASVRSWNKYGMWDVTPGTKPAVAIGLVGSLAAEILLDPTTWVGGFYTKIIKAAKFGRRTGQSADFLDIMRRGSLIEREADQTSMLSAFKPARVPDVVDGGYIDAHAGVKEWMKDAGVRTLGRTDVLIRNQFRSINRMVDRVNDAFHQFDKIDAFKQNLRETTELGGRDIEAAVVEEFGKATKIDALLRDMPALNVIMDSMTQWHMTQRRMVLLVDEDTGELVYKNVKDLGAEELAIVTDGAVPTLADEEGFWSFLADNAGWRALAKPLGGTTPEAMFIPRIGRFGARWMRGKKYMREILDLDDFPLHVKADMARMTAEYVAKQTDYVHTKVFEDLAEGTLELSVPLDEDMLFRVMLDPEMDQATRLGLSPEDHTKIMEHMKIHESNASQIILEDSELDDLLNYYLNDGFEVRLDERGVRRLMPVADIRRAPFTGAARAARRYYEKQVHSPGSWNAELTWLDQTKALTKAGLVGAAYYPARFAEKLTTYVPTTPWLDVTNSDTAVKEFTALVDMGIMAHMPRSQIDQYIRMFVMGNESERWLVQHDFFLDFIGRSGALVHGGRDVQDFIQRFIRHGNQRYGQLSDDVIGIHGLGTRRAVMPGAEFSAQLAKSNIIPNYRELAAMARYTAFYRMAGWGLHLPTIDKFISRAWRPAVLMRLGYVPRNGGEELFSWWLREGPRHWLNHKVARAAIGKHVVWDEYGRKILKDISDEERLPLIWKPFSRIWRSFNEIGGVGDFAITKKAVKKSIRENPRWKFLSEEDRVAFFGAARTEIRNEIEENLLGGTSRRLFEFANARANELTLSFGGSAISKDVAAWVGRRIDSQHDERVKAIAHMLTDPTILDEQMKDILGTFDPYINPNNLDMAMRDMEFGHVPDARLQLPMKYGDGELTWVSIEDGDFDALPRSVAVTQRLDYMRDDPGHRAFLDELINYVSPQRESVMETLAYDLGIPVETTASAAVLTYFRQHHPGALRELGESFDLVARSDNVDEVVKKITMHDAFIDELPEEIQDVVRRFLQPAPGVDQNPNAIAFLISHADPERLSMDLDEVVVRAKRAFVNEMLTLQGEQIGRAAHRAHIGFDEQGGVISDPLPPGAARLFVPMIPAEYVDELARILLDTGDDARLFHDEFVDRLVERLELIGIPRGEAYEAAQLLQPSQSATTISRTPSMYGILASAWLESGKRHVPLTVSSANPAIADAIAKTLTDLLSSRVGIESDALVRLRSRIGSVDVNAQELYGVSPLVGRQHLSGPVIPQARGGIRTSVTHPDIAVRNDSDAVSTFYGIRNGVPTAAGAFGSHGLHRKNMIGIAGEHLMPKIGEGLQPVQMLHDMPVTHTVHGWKHKETGRVVFRRRGDERNASWYDEDGWELVETQIVAHNDFHAAMEELAEINAPEILDLLSSADRAADTEIFLPWIREITTTDEISATRINDSAGRAGWWESAPERILGLLPPTEQSAGLGERIASGWTTIVRNWFDGVVNPLIGAMVREPMFQHYYVLAAKQVEGVKRNYRHTPYAYARLGKQLADADVGLYDDAGQLVIGGLDTFIELDWQVARLDPDAPISKVAFAVENGNRRAFIESVEGVLKAADDPDDITSISGSVHDALGALRTVARDYDSPAIYEFFEWAKNRKLQFETHRSVALQRAMTLTGAFIDDHRIRSQFQEMVGTMIPFWFAEDQFLRRLGRGLKHNPLMLRNLHLTMNAGVRGGLVQEDQFGEKKLVIPGSEVLTTAMLEIADRFPVVNAAFGGPLGAVARPQLAMDINIVPGYDLDQMGQMGFGPLLAAQINYASGRDPSLRALFKHNLAGSRYEGASKLTGSRGDTIETMSEVLWSSVLPAVIARPLQLIGIDGPDGSARTKAKIDVIKFMALNDMLPSEEEIAGQDHPALFQEEFLDRVDQMAKQYQLLQALTWFAGPATGTLADLTINDEWEWNTEFHVLLDSGMPYEEAYPVWVKNVEARTGEPFDPIRFSPFRTSAQSKIPFAVLETTQVANEWLVDNDEFIRTFALAAPFFMPRKFDADDDEYVAEAKTRQLNMGLRSLDTPNEYLEKLYHNIASPAYYHERESYLQKRYVLQKNQMDTTDLDRSWKIWFDSFQLQHPVFTQHIVEGTARIKREETVDQARLLVEAPHLVPDGEHKADILTAMATIVGFRDKIDALAGMRSGAAQKKRDAVRYKYWKSMELFTRGKPWLNELYYSVFFPLITDTWIAKYRAGLIEIDSTAVAA